MKSEYNILYFFGGIVLFLVALILLGNTQKDPPPITGEERIDNVERVLLNNPGQYTIFVSNGTQLEERHICVIGSSFDSITSRINSPKGTAFFQDAPKDKPMWILAKWVDTYNDGRFHEVYYLEFHLHSPQDINGGSWHIYHGGKSDSGSQGMNQVIE